MRLTTCSSRMFRFGRNNCNYKNLEEIYNIFQYGANAFSSLFILDVIINHKKTTSSLAPPIFNLVKKFCNKNTEGSPFDSLWIKSVYLLESMTNKR